ncbi:magnesium transporter CorA family protein [Agrilactobacillus yilanensis]|uniref:Magnesium transporter CorA family protein n=1 Tax=Agrilactobacillus yilanensis TaxID=2485997 RepID=A0ABW4JBQ2_9LACO|nr:magnesium transporter CorA family protein [Agrilactobacillus yilanensis]
MTVTTVTEQQQWIDLDQIDADQGTTTFEKYQMPKKFVPYIQDQRERARLEYDETSGYWLLVFRGIASAEAARFRTAPIAFIFNETNLMTINLAKEAFLITEISEIISLVKVKTLKSNFAIITECLLRMTNHYFDVIDNINELRGDLENLAGRPTNDAINQLTGLSKSLVYITTACNNNVIALEQLRLASNSKNDNLHLKAHEHERLGDAIVESKQALEMAQIATNVVDRVVNSYNNLLNNRLNDTMQFLTVWSIILMIPPIISGFYGMNVRLPFADRPWAWLWTIIWTLVLVAFLIIRFYRNRKP